MGCQTREVRHQIRLCELVAIVVRMTMSIWVAACDRRDAVQVIRLDELVVAKDDLPRQPPPRPAAASPIAGPRRACAFLARGNAALPGEAELCAASPFGERHL